jgi:ankyrin repeat protein
VNLIKSKCNEGSLNEKNNEEETPLMYALAQNSDEKLIGLFMSNENINIPNKNDEYPIDLAIKNERNEVLKMLQEKNAKSSSINL